MELKKLSVKNFMAVGEQPITILLNKTQGITCVSGQNGAGKCLDPYTNIEIEIDDIIVQRAFIDMIMECCNEL